MTAPDPRTSYEEPFPASADTDTVRAPERPTTIRYAFWAWMGAVALNLVTTAIAFATIGDTVDKAVADAARTAPAGADQAAIEAAARGGVYGALVGSLVFTLFVAFLAVRANGGAGWARIVLTVAGVVNVLLGLSALAVVGVAANGALVGSLGLLALLLQLAGLVLLWLRPSSAFFAEHKRAKAAAMR